MTSHPDKSLIWCVIRSQECIATNIYRLTLVPEDGRKLICRPGQFIALYDRDASRLLPRPISICACDGEALTLVYRAGGEHTGTRSLAGMQAGERVKTLSCLGNGYDIEAFRGAHAVLFGGGIGIPPMLQLARSLRGVARRVTVILGYKDKETFLLDEFTKAADHVYLSSDDGAVGVKGTVLTAFAADADKIRAEGEDMVLAACGPLPMLKGIKALSKELECRAFISLEERMACGVGVCLGCMVRTTGTDPHFNVNKSRICTEGPVFDAEDVELENPAMPAVSVSSPAAPEGGASASVNNATAPEGDATIAPAPGPLSVELAGILFDTPVFTASGTFGSGIEYAEMMDVSRLGAIVTKGVSIVPWTGNETPRVAETPSGMLNAIGLQNPGAEAFIEHDLPFLRRSGTRTIVNICGHSAQEYEEVLERLDQEAGIDAYEVNVSCPNVAQGGIAFGTDPARLSLLIESLRRRTKRPLIVKLSPNVTDITVTAKAAEAAGADAVSLINTLTGMKIDVEKRSFVLANRTGGLSGPAIHPIAVRMVYQVSHAVQIPVIGMGGVATAADALELILAGATAVSVGMMSFADPGTALAVTDGIEDYLRRHGIASVRELIGAVE